MSMTGVANEFAGLVAVRSRGLEISYGALCHAATSGGLGSLCVVGVSCKLCVSMCLIVSSGLP